MCLISEHRLSDPLLIIWEKKEYKILVYLNWEGRVLIYNSQTPPQKLIPPMWDKKNAKKSTTLRWVDVGDVAYALIIAFEIPSASGRYCLVERSAHAPQVIKILRGHYPTYKFLDK